MDDAVAETFTRFTLSAIAPVPWKNGGGTTREIACWPPQAGMEAFDWRISVACIDRDGAFSSFPGVDRVITLLEGNGVILHTRTASGHENQDYFGGEDMADHRATSHALTQRLVPHAFDGAAPIHGELVDGACEDLNIMSRRDRIQTSVGVTHQADRLPAASAGMLLAVTSAWTLQDGAGAPHLLAPGEGIWWSQHTHAWSVSPDAAASQAALVTVTMHDIRAARAPGGAA